MRLPWTTWGAVMETSHYIHNPELRRLRCLNTPEIREDLMAEGALFGAIWTYRNLKRIWLRDRAPVYTAAASQTPQPLPDDERQTIETALQQYAGYLNSFGRSQYVWNALDDIDELRQTSILSLRSLADQAQDEEMTTSTPAVVNPSENVSAAVHTPFRSRAHTASLYGSPIPFPLAPNHRRHVSFQSSMTTSPNNDQDTAAGATQGGSA